MKGMVTVKEIILQTLYEIWIVGDNSDNTRGGAMRLASASQKEGEEMKKPIMPHSSIN